jgi:hypothetical protein
MRYAIRLQAAASKGLAINGNAKVVPRPEKLNSDPIATTPEPNIAPTRPCVVEIGIPIRVAAKTVSAAPSAMDAAKIGDWIR